MVEYKNISKIKELEKLLTENAKTEDEEFDLIDELDLAISELHYNEREIGSILNPAITWVDIYNGYLTKLKANLISNFTEYEPLSPSKKRTSLDIVNSARHIMTTIMSLKYKFVEVMQKVNEGVPVSDAFSNRALQEINNMNISPNVFFKNLVNDIIEARSAITIQIDIDEDQLQTLIEACDSDLTQATLLLYVAEIREDALYELLDKSTITMEDILGGMGGI